MSIVYSKRSRNIYWILYRNVFVRNCIEIEMYTILTKSNQTTDTHTLAIWQWNAVLSHFCYCYLSFNGYFICIYNVKHTHKHTILKYRAATATPKPEFIHSAELLSIQSEMYWKWNGKNRKKKRKFTRTFLWIYISLMT